jgi:hypothetical protein
VIALVPLTWATPEEGYKEPHTDTGPGPASETHSGAHADGFGAALAAIQAAHANEVAALREQINVAEESRRAVQALADCILTQLAEASSRAGHAEKRAMRPMPTEGRRRRGRTEQSTQPQASAARSALHDRLDITQDELRQAREAADEASKRAGEAEAAINALNRADEARKARGRWARIRAALRGE